jgi:DNA-binding SARP family transcriptional activator
MEVNVLGPVEVWHAGRPVDLPGRQHRLVLGILILFHGELVPTDRLVDLLWHEHPPRRARASLHSRVSELRASLGDLCMTGARLVTRGNGYLLDIPDEQVDARRFRRVLAGWRGVGNDCVVRGCLKAAIRLWRGPVLGGELTGAAHATICHGLESARLTATEDLFEVELRLGNHQLLADEIVGLVAANPTRERLLGQAMVALSRVGRTAEALQAYERYRRWLGDEFGADPGGPVRQIHLALLRGDASAQAATTAAADATAMRP